MKNAIIGMFFGLSFFVAGFLSAVFTAPEKEFASLYSQTMLLKGLKESLDNGKVKEASSLLNSSISHNEAIIRQISLLNSPDRKVQVENLKD